MIEIKLLDNKCLEGIMNDFINSTEKMPEIQSKLMAEDEYMRLQAAAASLKEKMAGCPGAALMDEFEDTVLEMLGYETAAAYLDGIRKGVNLWRFLMDGDGRRQQVAAQDNAR